MKEDKGIAVMELDDVKIKLDNVGENSDLHTVDGTQLDGMDIDMIDTSSEHGVCADRENGLKSNNAVLIENHDSEPIVGMDSGRATTTADENMKSVDGGTDGASVESTKEVIATCDATFTSTSCKDNGTADENRESGEGGIDGVSLESTKEVLVTCDAAFTSTSCNNGDPVSCCVTESEEPASCESKNVNVQVVSVDNASTNEDAGLGIEAEDKVHEMQEKPHTNLPMLETDSVVASVPRQDTNEEFEGHAAHQQTSLPDGSPVRRVNPGLECEPDLALDKCFDKNGIDGATAQVDTNAENQERRDQDANADVCMEDSTIRDSDAGIRNDTNIHEQPSCPDETVINCANQQLECELDTSIVECLDKNTTNGLAQGGSKAEDIQETQGQAANDEQVVAMDAASAGDENVTELHNPVTSAILDNQVMHAESEMEEKLNTSTPIQESEVPDDLIDVSDVMNSYTDPKQDENEECEGFVAYEQRPLLDESLGRGSDQQEKCEPDTSVGECLVKSATDGVALDGTNMDGIQEMKEATGPIQQIELPVEQLVDEDPDSNSVKPQSKDEKNVRHESIATQQVESPETDVPKQVELPEEEVVDEDPVSDSTYAQRTDEENARHESAPTQQVDLPEIAVPAQQVELPEIAVHAQQVELPEQQEVNEDPVSFSANPQSKDEENARHESAPPQQVELPETAVPTQQVELPEEQEVNEDPISDSANPQSMDGENGRHESTPTQQVELIATDVPTQQVQLPEDQEVDEDPVYPQSMDEENAGHESTPTLQVELPATNVPTQQVELPEDQKVDEDPVYPQSMDEENARHESTSTQQVELPATDVPTQQVQLPEDQKVDEDPVYPQSMDEENARHESTSTQQVELPATDVPTQQVELPEDQKVDEDPVYPQSMDEENAKHESTSTQQVELPETAVPTQQVELPEGQKVDEDPVYPQSMDEENARHESTSTQQVELPATDVPTQQVQLPEDQKVDEDPVYPQSMDEENARHESTSTQQVELPATDVPTQQVELPEDQKVDEDPVYPQSMDEENAKHESTSTQQVELPETAVPTQQVELPEDQEVDEDPVSDSANQSMDEENAGHEPTPIQQVELPETAVLTQQVDLPEDQEVNEDPVCPQSMDEENARDDSTPTQQVELPQSAVPTQQVELPEDQAVDEDLVSDSANPQSMDEENAEHESTVTPQDELPETAVPTQQVELPEDQEVDEDPVSDSANAQSKDEKNARLESIPVPQVESAETAGPTQPVELLDEREIDEDPVSDSANPQSKDEKNAGCGSTPTQAVESPEAAVSTEQVELPEEQEVNEDPVSDSAKLRSKDEKHSRRGSVKYGSFVSDRRVTYQLPPEDETGFSVFDLVWGKVKSHPWWPGQIFHPSDSSEKAMKYYKKDCYLVAYFGDRSFAWNDASVLKPFMKHFSQEEKQSSTESFQNAVKCALAEVSRRVELGLACSCISEAAYEKIKYQLVENGGIREESSKREGIARSTGPDTLHSAKLVEYVRALAISPTSGADRLDVVIAKAQLLAFNRLKGCDALAEFQYYDGLAEFDTNSSLSREKGMLGESELGDSGARDDDKTRLKGTRKRKHNLKDIVYQRRKEKSLTELMGETIYYLDGEFDSHEEDDIGLTSPTPGSKRKGSSYVAGDVTTQPSTKTISFAKVSHTASSTPPQSFKVGECIRRVASQLTGSPSILKCASDGSDSKVIGDDVDEVIDAPDDSVTESTITPQKQPSPEEMISQLHLSARDPMKGYSFLGDIISFFYEFRNAAVSAQRQKMRKGPGRKRKASVPAVGSPEAFEFDDRNDSYWTDMVVQNHSEAKPARRGRKRKENHIVAVDSEKPPQTKRRKYTRKQYFHGNHAPAAEIPARDEKQDLLPTELMLNFGDVGSIPSEVNLNKMFRRFGPLKESETEINAQSSRARVVFKKRSDAEVAYSSATMFNVFGSTLVNYQLNYTPSISLGTSPLALSDTVEHAT